MSRKPSLFDSFVEDIIRGTKGKTASSAPAPSIPDDDKGNRVSPGATMPELLRVGSSGSASEAKEESFLDAFIRRSQSLFSTSREGSVQPVSREAAFASPFARAVLQWQRENASSLVLITTRCRLEQHHFLQLAADPSAPTLAYPTLAAVGLLLIEKHAGTNSSSSAHPNHRQQQTVHCDNQVVRAVTPPQSAALPPHSESRAANSPQPRGRDADADDLDVAPSLVTSSSPVRPVPTHPFPSDRDQHRQRVKHRILDFYDRYDPKRCPNEEDVNRIADSGIPEHVLFNYLQTQYGLSAFAVSAGGLTAAGGATSFALSPDPSTAAPPIVLDSSVSSDSLDVIIPAGQHQATPHPPSRGELRSSWKAEWTELLAPFVPNIDFRATSWNTAPSGSNSKSQFREANADQQCFTFHGVPVVLCHKDLTVRPLMASLFSLGSDVVELAASPRDVPRISDELESLVFAHVALVPVSLRKSCLHWNSGVDDDGRGPRVALIHDTPLENRLGKEVEDMMSEERDAVDAFNRAAALGIVGDMICEEFLRELDDPAFCHRQRASHNTSDESEGGAADFGTCEGDDGFDDRSVASPVPF